MCYVILEWYPTAIFFLTLPRWNCPSSAYGTHKADLIELARTVDRQTVYNNNAAYSGVKKRNRLFTVHTT